MRKVAHIQTSVVCGVNTWQQIVDFSVHSTHVGDEVLFFDDDGEGLDTRVFFSIENSEQGLERQSCSFTVRIGEHAHTKWRGDHVLNNSKLLERCKEVTIRFWQEVTSVFVLIGSSTIRSNDVNDVLESVAQCKRFSDDVDDAALDQVMAEMTLDAQSSKVRLEEFEAWWKRMMEPGHRDPDGTIEAS